MNELENDDVDYALDQMVASGLVLRVLDGDGATRYVLTQRGRELEVDGE